MHQVHELAIPTVKKTFTVPIVGKFDLLLRNVEVLDLEIPNEMAHIEIMDGSFLLTARKVGSVVHMYVPHPAFKLAHKWRV